MTPNNYRLMLLGAVTPRKRPTASRKSYPNPEHQLVPTNGSINPSRPELPLPEHNYILQVNGSATIDSRIPYGDFTAFTAAGMAPNFWENSTGQRVFAIHESAQRVTFYSPMQDMQAHYTTYINDFANLPPEEKPIKFDSSFSIDIAFPSNAFTGGQGAYMTIDLLDNPGDKHITVSQDWNLEYVDLMSSTEYVELTDYDLNTITPLAALTEIRQISARIKSKAFIDLPMASHNLAVKITLVDALGKVSSTYLTYSMYVGDCVRVWEATANEATGQTDVGFPSYGGKAYRRPMFSDFVDTSTLAPSGVMGKFTQVSQVYTPYTGAPIPSYTWEDHQISRTEGARGWAETDYHKRRKTKDTTYVFLFPKKPLPPQEFIEAMWPKARTKITEYYKATYSLYSKGETAPLSNEVSNPPVPRFKDFPCEWHRFSAYTKGPHSEPYELTEVFLTPYDPVRRGYDEYGIPGEVLTKLDDAGLKFGLRAQVSFSGNVSGMYVSVLSTVQSVTWMNQAQFTVIDGQGTPEEYIFEATPSEYILVASPDAPNHATAALGVNSAGGVEPNVYTEEDPRFVPGLIHDLEPAKELITIRADDFSIVVNKVSQLYNELNEKDNPSNPDAGGPIIPYVWVSGAEGLFDIPPELHDELLGRAELVDGGYVLDAEIATGIMAVWAPILEAQQAQLRIAAEYENGLRHLEAVDRARELNDLKWDTIYDLPKYQVTVQVPANAMDDVKNVGKFVFNAVGSASSALSIINGLKLLFTASLTASGVGVLIGMTYLKSITLGKQINRAQEALDNLQNRGKPITIYLKSDETLQMIKEKYPQYELEVEPFDRNKGPQSGMIR